MNTITKSWCKFTEWDAEDFAVFNNELYFCHGTAVYKAWTGTADAGGNIDFYAKQAFQDFGDSRKKQAKMFMPILSVNGNVQFGADIDVDFEDDTITGTISYTTSTGSQWDSALWDSGTWGSGMEMVKQWTSPAEWEGRWLAGKVKITSNALVCQWMGSTMIYEPGSGI
jgi:hypothetical protein